MVHKGLGLRDLTTDSSLSPEKTKPSPWSPHSGPFHSASQQTADLSHVVGALLGAGPMAGAGQTRLLPSESRQLCYQTYHTEEPAQLAFAKASTYMEVYCGAICKCWLIGACKQSCSKPEPLQQMPRVTEDRDTSVCGGLGPRAVMC